MSEMGTVETKIEDGVATIRFFHPKKNSLPGALLRSIAYEIDKVAENKEARVIVLASEGEGPFCAGASFEELQAAQDPESGKQFFMGFALVILALKKCPQLTIGRIHGKAVGGGVGLASAVDYALATKKASLKLSELALGIGPFVVGPAVERKLGLGGFSAMSIDTDWRDAKWAFDQGFYAHIYDSIDELDQGVAKLSQRLAQSSPEAMSELKKVFWEGTENWNQLLTTRAEISGRLVLSEFTKKAIATFKQKGK